MNARSFLSVLCHAEKALDLVSTARDLGILARLDEGPVSLQTLVDATGARPRRLYKFLDALESLGLVTRQQSCDDPLTAQYLSRERLVDAAEAVLGERSIERDRDKYPWREIYGRLGEVLAGRVDARFEWPPKSADDIRAFETSMAAGCAPIVETLRNRRSLVFGNAHRWLDVGGGDGTLVAELLCDDRTLHADVFNLPPVAPLVHDRARASGLEGRLGFVGGDFFLQDLPGGYDVVSFVRVLHDWPAAEARSLLEKARNALAPGGRLVICEEFRTRDRLAVQLFWTYFLVGVDGCVSRLREVEWYTEALQTLGFRDIAVVPDAFDLVVAVRQ
jgi:demethylspheroidene O-methyltransferase